MIKTIFPTHILVKDLSIAENESFDILNLIDAMISQHKAETSLSIKHIAEDSLPFFTNDNLKKFPVLQKIRNHFIDGFWELSKSYDSNTFTKELIEELVCRYTGRLPIMQNGNFKPVHNHTGASAFAILYMSDVDNTKHGGKLTLHCPSWSSNIGYTNKQIYEVETRKHRLVVVPANIWHSVTPYTGNEDRIAIVFNLDVVPVEILEKITKKK